MKKYLLLCSIFFAGCMVGPNYRRPEVSMPTKYEENKPEVAAADEDFLHWWKELDDPLLNSLIDEAVQGNYDFKIAIEKILQARAQYRIESSYLWPSFDFNAVATRSRYSQNFFTTASGASVLPKYQDLYILGFDAVWELDFWGKFRRAKRAALYQWEAIKEDAQNVLISMISEVALNYVNIRALQKQIELTKEKIRIGERIVILTNDLFMAGLASEIQLENLVALLESNRAQIPQMETSLKQTTFALAYLLGKQPEGLEAQFATVAPIPSGLHKVPVGLPSDLLRRRPDIRASERQLAAATEQIGVAVADLFPHVSLTGNTFSGGQLLGSTWGYQSSSFSNLLSGGSNTWSVGPSFFWNIIDFGRIRANIDVQNSLQRQALLNYEQIVISALKDVEGALVAYFEEQKRRRDFANEVIAYGRSLQLSEDLFLAGLVSEIDVLNAKKLLIDSESSLISSEQSLTNDLIALYKALGGSWEKCCASP
jgi:multidrug efflux system outer membrane protein